MAQVKRVYEPGELDALLTGGEPATADDVSITMDGRRLDSADAVIEFFDELRRERAQVEQGS